MELRVLKYFLAIAREENFTRAAQQLHVTQPTLSRQIADLEQELGVKLFRRSNHNVVLTEDGMILKRRAQELLTLADKTKRDFLHRGEQLEGTVAIGSGEFLATRCLTDCIAAFHRMHPQVRYELVSGNAGNLLDQIERGLLDLALLAEPIDIRKYNFVPTPVQEEWGALVQANSALAQKASLSPQDLVGLPLISCLSDPAQERLQAWFGPYAGQLDVLARGSLMYNEALLAQSNVGAVIGIRLACQYTGLRFIPFSPPLQNRTALIWKKEQVFSTATSAFLEFTIEYLLGISSNNG